MPTTFHHLQRFLDESSLAYVADERRGTLTIEFDCSLDGFTYRDPDGRPRVVVCVRISEKGEFVSVSAPGGWRLAGCPHLPAVCAAAARAQAGTKLIRFDLDDDGVLRPNVEISLETAPLCRRQLYRALGCVMQAIRRYDTVFRHAMETGEVDLDRMVPDRPSDLPGEFRQLIDLAAEAGGFDVLARLLAWDEPTPPADDA